MLTSVNSSIVGYELERLCLNNGWYYRTGNGISFIHYAYDDNMVSMQETETRYPLINQIRVDS